MLHKVGRNLLLCHCMFMKAFGLSGKSSRENFKTCRLNLKFSRVNN